MVPPAGRSGAGVITLDCLLWMARERSEVFRRLFTKADGARSEFEYPFCAGACIHHACVRECVPRHLRCSCARLPHADDGRSCLCTAVLHVPAGMWRATTYPHHHVSSVLATPLPPPPLGPSSKAA